MELIDDLNQLFGDKLKDDLTSTSKVRIAAVTKVPEKGTFVDIFMQKGNNEGH